MSSYMLIFPIFIPIALGALSKFIHFRTRRAREIFLLIPVFLTTVLVWALILNRPEGSLTLFRFTKNLAISLRLDDFGSFFAVIVATLWPIAMVYAYEYISPEKRTDTFLALYTMTYGVTLGVSFASSLLSMYFFYELLTLVTVPLVMFTMTEEAKYAARKYLYFSLGGTAFAFIGLVFVIVYGTTDAFLPGGVLNLESIANVRLLQIVYIFTFCGFGVKAAVFPVHSWLPEAAVAPTPVTALLHAVAVVKSGVFGITRVTYFTFGADFLRGTWAQYAAIAIALFTILYGSSLAARERHFKRRLAWSTVANLSYILFGVLLLSPSGLASGMMHMLFHAFMKITLFYCAGAVLYKTEREYLSELDGLGYRMPVTFVCYTVSALALTGVPPLSGFYSKFALGAAGILDGGVWGVLGTVILLASALLTAIYALYPAVRAFLPQKGAILPPKDIHDPNAYMLVPMIFTSAATVLFGLFSVGIYDWLYRIASGVFGGGL
ncbi:MAG: proton-conducting membrane transporter [Clostridiaceae bacterium]|nr:proton-conducting membrane transporter [Clostridiaceae bacterium]